jgi:lysophospholipase L1-like esterase
MLLVVSVALNVAVLTGAIALVARRGGIPYLKQALGLAPRQVQPRPFQTEKVELFRKLPRGGADVVFAGDSHVAGAPFAEVYTAIRNRGIGGDTTAGFLTRLDEITRGKPQSVFLQLGCNDVANRIPVSETIANYRLILSRIRSQSPGTRIFVMSVPPAYGELRGRNPQIRALNDELRALASAQAATFIDLSSVLTDADGNLKLELAMGDGVHLNTAGHLLLCEALRPHLPHLPAVGASPDDQATGASEKASK